MLPTRSLLTTALLCGLAPGLSLGEKPAVSVNGANALVDRYGQNARLDFPLKVKGDDELKADVAAQKATLEAFSGGPTLDSYGGLAGSGARFHLTKTGFFHVGKAGERQVLVTPEGNAFFQLAVCGIALSDDYTLVAGREQTYEWLPPKDGPLASAWRPETSGVVSFYAANWVRKFGRPFDLEEWSGQVVDRLRHWGFNSAGAFSQNTKTMRELNFPYVSFLPGSKEVTMLPDKVGASEVIDPFAPNAAEALDKAFAARLPAAANDPLLIGYFLGNEQHFELLPKIIPAYQASKVPAKARLVAWLREKYATVDKFNAAWNPAKPLPDWAAAGEEPLFVRTEQGAADMQEFYRFYLESYYTLVSKTFHKYDKNHLLIGNRLTPGTANNKDAVEIAGKYMDVMSVNYYTYPLEGDFLKQVHDWSGGRPIILSEWYYSATDQGLGGGKEVKDQTERAKAYRNYVEQAAALPFVIGSQWFIYNDQSITGRYFEGFHGEGNNTGLVNVADRPYPELTAAARETANRIYDVMFGQKEAFVFKDPRFDAHASGPSNKVVAVPKALPGLALDGTTRNWPPRPAEPIESSRLVLGNPNPNLRGDFRLCWDETNLYFLIQVKDVTPGRNEHEPKSFWSGDNVELFIGTQQPGQKGSMIFSDRQILLGAGKKPGVFIGDHADEASKCRSLVVQDVSRDGYVASISIPWEVLGVKPSPGLELLFDVGIDNSDDGKARKQQLMWNGTAENNGSRENWGRARLVEN